MSRQRTRNYGAFLGKTIALTVGTAALAIFITGLWVYNLAPSLFNQAAQLFPQPFVVSGWTLAYLSVWALLFVTVSLILFRLNLRKI